MKSKPKNRSPVVIRSQVDPKKNYLDYRDALRYDFLYSCAYCWITEIEASGLGFSIDHYYPQKARPESKNEYSNLMWSCHSCNRYKSDFSPSEHDIKFGRVILRPDNDDPRDHYDYMEYSLSGKTPIGEFNIKWLDLNRMQLRRLRRIREKFYASNSYIAYGISELSKIKLDTINPQKRYIFLKIRNQVIEYKERVVDSMDELIRDFAHSPFLDSDPDKKKRLKARKEFLDSQKVIIYDHLTEKSK